MNKIKILFVISQFSQGGAERYLYEICKHINKQYFQVEILTVKRVKQEFYYHKLKEVGVVIHERCVRRRLLGNRLAYAKPLATAIDRMLLYMYKFFDFFIPSLLSKFNIISVIQIENYYQLVPYTWDNIHIHLLSHQVQYGGHDVYSGLSKKEKYHFITMDKLQQDEVIASRGNIGSFFCWSLALDLDDYKKVSVGSVPCEPIKIGVFTRLSAEKPLDAFFRALAKMRNKVNVTLHVYGGGNQEVYDDFLEDLQIKDIVTFEGHRQNMNDAVVHDGLSLCWMLSLNDTVGYASIELGGAMMPVIFWNLSDKSFQDILESTSESIYSFNDIEMFVDFTEKALINMELLESIGLGWYTYVKKKYGIQTRIRELEKYYLQQIDLETLEHETT